MSPTGRCQGVGAALLSALVSESAKQGIWTFQAGIFLENIAGIRLHKRLGFCVVGTRERIGCTNGRWRDVVLLELRTNAQLSDSRNA
jgi:L-amino acid N-acyltransferase YncA